MALLLIVVLLGSYGIALWALGQILHHLRALTRKVDRTMTKIDDLKAAVADLKSAQTDQFGAIDREITQLSEAIAGSGLPADQAASLQESLDNITAATQAARESTAKLAGDDPTA